MYSVPCVLFFDHFILLTNKYLFSIKPWCICGRVNLFYSGRNFEIHNLKISPSLKLKPSVTNTWYCYFSFATLRVVRYFLFLQIYGFQFLFSVKIIISMEKLWPYSQVDANIVFIKFLCNFYLNLMYIFYGIIHLNLKRSRLFRWIRLVLSFNSRKCKI